MEKEMRYQVRKLTAQKEYEIQVPGSKSMTNRALLLAALSDRICVLSGVLFSDDTRGFLDCLQQLGFDVKIEEEQCRVTIQGAAGRIPKPETSINVRSAGTAARFLTVALAFAGGSYHLDASEQMRKRPMQPILTILEELNVKFKFNNEEYHFPFEMTALRDCEEEKSHNCNDQKRNDEIRNNRNCNGENRNGDQNGENNNDGNENKEAKRTETEIIIDTGLSSQFASALLMAACILPDGLRIRLTGTRTEGSYIKMTLAMMKQFGIEVEILSHEQNEICYRIGHQDRWGLEEYTVEPDVSAACYFYAMAPILRTSVIVKGVHRQSLQGDIQFLRVLEQMGCQSEETGKGIRIWFGEETDPHGVDISMKDFSDQTMTLAAIAPFADTPTTIRNIGHIRFQESDRLHAILTELGRLGIRCEEVTEADGIRIWPLVEKIADGNADEERVADGQMNKADTVPWNDSVSGKLVEIETYEDHRMAMAFTLPGLVRGGIAIKNPGCCGKTFEHYFDVIDSLYGENVGFNRQREMMSRYPYEKTVKNKNTAGKERLNKYLASCGVCSRRDADRLVEQGLVTVNGNKASIGMKVSSRDVILVRGKAVCGKEDKVVFAYYKPVGVTCTERDRFADKKITDMVKFPVRVTYAGRLDRDSEGLILLTNDGALIQEMMKGSNGHEKEYVVRVDKEITEKFVQEMQKGVWLEELSVRTKPCEVMKLGKYTFKIILTQGVNRQIRRMAKALGYEVRALKRIRVVNVELANLKNGEFRQVLGEELQMLYQSVYKYKK